MEQLSATKLAAECSQRYESPECSWNAQTSIWGEGGWRGWWGLGVRAGLDGESPRWNSDSPVPSDSPAHQASASQPRWNLNSFNRSTIPSAPWLIALFCNEVGEWPLCTHVDHNSTSPKVTDRSNSKGVGLPSEESELGRGVSPVR